MKFSSKTYKILKTKNYLRDNDLFFFFNSISQNSNGEILIEQSIKRVNLNSYKIFNKTSKTTISNSVYKNSNELINSMTLLIKPVLTYNEFKKSNLLNCFEPLLFNMLAIKLNNKIYSITQFKEIMSFNFKDINILLFQFNTTNLKILLKK